jgi:hypothetical protein
MKLSGWLVTALVAGGAVYGIRGGCVNSTAPDEELADHFEELCEIAGDNIDTPKKGVKKIGRYFARHLDDILGDFGSTIVTIEKISDDRKHDERARLARDRMQRPWMECRNEWQQFWIAVDGDPEASEMANRAMDRLGRTFEIIFNSTNVDLRNLPDAFLNKID